MLIQLSISLLFRMNIQRQQIKTSMQLRINPMTCNLLKDTIVEGKNILEDVLTRLPRVTLAPIQMNVTKDLALKAP